MHARRQGNFGVASCAERTGELLAKLAVVVEFAVVGDHMSAGGVGHRLVAFGGRINDRQACVGQPDGEAGRLGRPDAGVVRSAMTEAATQILQQTRIDGPASKVDDAGDTAHAGALSRPLWGKAS